MDPQELSVLRLVQCAPVAIGSCEPEMSRLAERGQVEQFLERIGLQDRPTWRITAEGEAVLRAEGSGNRA